MELVKKDRVTHWPGWFTQGFPGWVRSFDLPDFDDWADRAGMRVEERREDGTLVVKAEIPGVDPDKDIEIVVDHGVLEIRAERQDKQEQKDEKKGIYRSEFRYGSFMRRVPLPPGASEDDVKATYQDGILEVQVPISETEEPAGRKIPISQA